MIRYSLSERGSSLQLKGLVQDGPRLVPFLYFGFKQHLFCIKHSVSAQRILIPYQSGPQSQFIPVLPFLECRQCHCQFCHACEVCSGEHWWEACPYQSTQWECRSRSPNPSIEKVLVVLILGSPHHFNVYIVLVALVPKLWFLVPVCYVPVQVPVKGTHCPVVPVCSFPCSHIPMVVGHCSVIGLQTICSPAGLPQALSLATRLPTFFQAAWSYSNYVTRASLHSLSCLG